MTKIHNERGAGRKPKSPLGATRSFSVTVPPEVWKNPHFAALKNRSEWISSLIANELLKYNVVTNSEGPI